MRFLCDEMLKRLGQWLRAAGYDVVILPDGSTDHALVDRAMQDHRLLLTRDRGISDEPAVEALVCYLDCDSLEDCVAALNARLPIDWHFRPFTRCMVCNTPLVDAGPAQRCDIPTGVQETGSSILYCPTCKKTYWDGSHVARMRRRLDAFAAAGRTS